MLRRLAVRDAAIVREIDLELAGGFSVLTGETGAGKSILVDAVQFVLGGRADAAWVREGAARAEVSAEFDAPASLAGWLDEAGYDATAGTLLLRRALDGQGRSRAWINGSAATLAQLREVAEHLVDIHGQHAWQGLTRPSAVRALLDAQAGVQGTAMETAWAAWRAALKALVQARAQRDTLAQERERLAWQIGELDRLAPGEHEWEALNAEHTRLSNAQALLDAARTALDAISEADASADALCSRAITALDGVHRYDTELAAVAEVLRGAQAQLEDAAHTLGTYLGHRDPDPERLAELDTRLATWMALARRFKRAPAELPPLLADWKESLRALDAGSDLDALERAAAAAEAAWREAARERSRARHRVAPKLAAAVTQAMQQLGMAGGRFEVALLPQAEPSPMGLEDVELHVAGHAGSTPRPLAKVASGGELSRLALAIAVTTSRAEGATGAGAATLIFDEIDAGVGGTVADAVGRLMKQLGRSTQVLAVTHLAQVAACADQHCVVSKQMQQGRTTSAIAAVSGEARVAEIARMLGGERLSGTSRAHAAALLAEQRGGDA
ncbi:MAG: DNA repair protein RecN [Rubrivivax sp.]|nr:DNA repair protein RecN [Rubrivivax sp.]